jgi:hypothetical protein
VGQVDPWAADDLKQVFANCKKLKLMSLRSTCVSENRMNVDFGMTWTRGDEKDDWSLLQTTTVDKDEGFLTARAFEQSWVAFQSRPQWKRADIISPSFAALQKRIDNGGLPTAVEHLCITTRIYAQKQHLLRLHDYWPKLQTSQWRTYTGRLADGKMMEQGTVPETQTESRQGPTKLDIV